MIIIDDYRKDYPYKDELCCAFGYFDGFHLGHMKVLEKTLNQPGLKSAAFTFTNRPLSFVAKSNKPDSIMSTEDRIAFFEKIGIEYLFIFDFDEELMRTTKEEFIEKFMVRYNVKKAVVGFNYTFGANKSGNCDNIKQLCGLSGIDVEIVPPECYGGVVISSTVIKKALYKGNIPEANQMLGRPFYLKGPVEGAKQLGRQIGYPTANTVVEHNMILPKWGVYATKCHVEGKTYYGMTNVGNNPTVEDGSRISVETHLIDFNKDIYGAELTVEFLYKIRGEHKFSGVEELVEQLKRDEKAVRELMI